jgi:hypothetical protein
MNRERWLVWLLRAAGAFGVLAFFAVVMPRGWMEAAHAWLGMGEMLVSPLLMFLIRQSSYVYGMHGVSLFVLATDVRRFRPLIILNGVSFLLAAPVFYLIDVSAGIPWWWALSDVLGCGSLGAGLLWLTLTRDSTDGAAANP